MIRRIETIISRYEDRKDDKDPDCVLVQSHSTHSDRVVIAIPGMGTCCVLADDLRRAIDNAVNHK